MRPEVRDKVGGYRWHFRDLCVVTVTKSLWKIIDAGFASVVQESRVQVKSGVQSTLSQSLCLVGPWEAEEGFGCRMLNWPFCCSFNSGSWVTLTATAGLSSVAEHEDALLRHLFQGYQKWVRPVLNSSDIIKVYFGLKISQLVDVVSSPQPCIPKNTQVSMDVTPDICLSLTPTMTFYK